MRAERLRDESPLGGFGSRGLGVRVEFLFRVSGFYGLGQGFKVHSQGFRVQGSGFRVQGLGFMAHG